jgi:hypothetical protein
LAIYLKKGLIFNRLNNVSSNVVKFSRRHGQQSKMTTLNEVSLSFSRRHGQQSKMTTLNEVSLSFQENQTDEFIYDELETAEDQSDNIPIVPNGICVVPNGICVVPNDCELLTTVKKKQASSDSNVSTAETSLSDNVLINIDTTDGSAADTSAMEGTSGMSYVKVALQGGSGTPEEVLSNAHTVGHAGDRGNSHVYDKPDHSKHVANVYDQLNARVLPVMRDDFPVPENVRSKLPPSIDEDKPQKLSNRHNLCDATTESTNSGLDSDSDINTSGSCDNSGEHDYKQIPKNLFNQLILCNDDPNSTSGSTTDYTDSAQDISPNHNYRKPTDSACSYESTSGSYSGSGSNQDYRGGGPGGGSKNDEVCGKQFGDLRYDSVSSQDGSRESKS